MTALDAPTRQQGNITWTNIINQDSSAPIICTIIHLKLNKSKFSTMTTIFEDFGPNGGGGSQPIKLCVFLHFFTRRVSKIKDVGVSSVLKTHPHPYFGSTQIHKNLFYMASLWMPESCRPFSAADWSLKGNH